MDSKAEQYYPTYTFKPESRDIVLLEFEEAQKIANGQTKVYGQVTNVLIAIITVMIPLFFSQKEEEIKENLSIIKLYSLPFAIVLTLFGGILLRYFVELQRDITINARKVVTLRTMLGLDYGNIHLTLPNWRVEGAINPFVIKYFNGWLWFQTVPFYVLTVGLNVIWWLATRHKELYTVHFYSPEINWFWGNIAIVIWYYYIFRYPLNEQHETPYLHLAKGICKLFRIKLLDNFEYILYRAKLSYIELDRLRIDYTNLKSILVNIEENRFHRGRGFSFKALIRGFLSRFSIFRKRFGYIPNGGSTITMQLTRSLFIPSTQNKYLRKIGEILLSFWLNQQFSKDEILKLYIASVRYERGIYGLANATKYFFGELRDRNLTIEESFFLVERLSNINSKVNWQRVDFLSKKIDLPIDVKKLNLLYKEQIKKGVLKD